GHHRPAHPAHRRAVRVVGQAVGGTAMEIRNSRRRLASLVMAAVFLPALATAQGGVGAITGTIQDGTGAVLPGVTVMLVNPGVIGGTQQTVSDGRGSFQFTRLVPGTYTVRAELAGFQSTARQNIVVNADFTARADLTLMVGEIAETVTVSGEAPLL